MHVDLARPARALLRGGARRGSGGSRAPARPGRGRARAAEGERETVVETHADGSRSELGYVTNERGERLEDGPYRRWHANGRLAVEGQYAGGLRTGEWTAYHPAGDLESRGQYKDGEPDGKWTYKHPGGRPKADGSYKNGLRNSRWLCWDSGGKSVREDSGEYTAELEFHPNGQLARAGEKRNELRHGRWRWWLSDGALICEAHFARGQRSGPWLSIWPSTGHFQIVGEYLRDQRVGTWTFRHADGSFDGRMLSGQFDQNRRLGVAEVPAPDAQIFPASDREPGGPGALGNLPPPSPTPGATPAEREEVAAALREVAALPAAERGPAAAGLVELGAPVIPLILRALQNLDLSLASDVEIGRFLAEDVLRVLHARHSFGWRAGTTPDDVFHNRVQIVRWSSLWELTRSDPTYLSSLAEIEPQGVPSQALLSPPVLEPAWVAVPEQSRSPRWNARDRARLARELGSLGTQAALDAGLVWLARAQAPDGRWSAAPAASSPLEGAPAPYALREQRASALALLALLGAGHAGESSELGRAALRGGRWLAEQHAQQLGSFAPPGTDGGLPRGALEAQALAATVFAELLEATGDAKWRPPLESALAALFAARTAEGGWRTPGSPADETLLTAWAVGALCAAEAAGIEIEIEVAHGALAAIHAASDPRSGGAGSRARANGAEAPAKPAQASAATTGAALFSRALLGQSAIRVPLVGAHRDRLAAAPPSAAPFDALGWFFASHAMFQMGGETWQAWSAALEAAALGAQDTSDDQSLRGSWPPDARAEALGGRVASTALAALALEVTYRLPRRVR